jgi:hypothetical protein
LDRTKEEPLRGEPERLAVTVVGLGDAKGELACSWLTVVR